MSEDNKETGLQLFLTLVSIGVTIWVLFSVFNS